ncbi:MAG: prolyl oligopeptidase family serine peptidase [Candidatus Lokiarchaeota archaeon]|nr:prolyl oligopeptidase family serine peptidase [Candidatus Lokiarchaeota archaeon]
MEFRIITIMVPLYAAFSLFLTYMLIFVYAQIFIGVIYFIISSLFVSALIFIGYYDPQEHFYEITSNLIDMEKAEIVFDDGVKTIGNFYRAASETIENSDGKKIYPNPRPMIIYFHGFQTHKEECEKYLIPLANMGYICFSFDQRGHGEAGGKKNEYFKNILDSIAVLDAVCSYEDVRKNSICCIGSSVGGVSVLTKCYADERVAMVVGISTLHRIRTILETKYRFLSIGWVLKRSFKTLIDEEEELKLAPYYYLKQDREYNKNRVFLIHAKNELIFPPEITFELNKKHARIPDDQALLLDRGRHSFGDMEVIILSAIVKWLNKNKKMKLPIE